MSRKCWSKQRDDHADAGVDEKKKSGAGVVTTTSLSMVNNKNQQPEFETEFEKWVAKQSLPIEAAVSSTITGAYRGAVIGYVVDLCFRLTCGFTAISGVSLCPKKLSLIGEYKPLLVSFVEGGTLEQTRNFGVMMGVNSGISHVIKKLRGKEDVQTRMVSGFGSGVVLSLVTGMRGPSVISVGVVFALVNGGLIKVQEKFRLSKDPYAAQ